MTDNTPPDVESPSPLPSTSLPLEEDVLWSELYDGLVEETFDALFHFAAGGLDVTLLMVAFETLALMDQYDVELNGRASVGVFVCLSALVWWWALAKFICPAFQIFAPKTYWSWLGNAEWTCCCDGWFSGGWCCNTEKGQYGCFHPCRAIYIDIVVSDILVTVWSYYDGVFDENPDLFYIKAVVSVVSGVLDLRKVCFKIKKAQAFHQARN